MAIAGLHNVSVLENSVRMESQSQQSRRQENGSTRPSSILQMWRELEDEHVVNNAQERENVSENEFGQWSQDRFGSQRLMQIQEWMNNGGRERASTISLRNNSSRPQWLGEAEQERVGTTRECVQMNSQQRGACIQSREAQAADIGGHIERVLSGLVVNQNEHQTERVSRGIRKLCGRQALNDMLKKAESERQTEVQGLLELRAVSKFSHRKRIQSLLRGRFLRNDKRVASERCTSTAASELGLLRQKQTVSGLREGFRSRLDSFGCVPASSRCSDTSSNTDTTDVSRQEASTLVEECRDERRDVNDQILDGDRQENIANVSSLETLQNEAREHSGEASYVHFPQDGERSGTYWLPDDRENLEQNLVQYIDGQESASQILDGDRQENIANVSSLETLQNEAREHSGEASYVHFPQDGERSGTYWLPDDRENLEQNLVQYIDGQESASQVEGQQEENNENNIAEWQEARVEHNVLMDGSNEEASNMHHEDGGNEDGSLHEATRNQLEGSYNQESEAVRRTYTFYLPDDDDVQSVELRELLNRRSVSSLLRSGFRESLDQFMQSYVERQNDPSFELESNETSATPASVEQDVEQQSRDQNEGQRDAEVSPLALPLPRMPYMLPLWDQDSLHRAETFATPSVEQGVVQQSRDRNEGRRDAEISLLALPLPNMPYTQPLWDRDSYHHYNWAPDSVHQRFGMECDIINDLRVDLDRMQQRMNSMQRMLGACMEMQLELQRAIRQEVSASLNHSAGSQGIIHDNSLSKNSHNWDSVRKGICCICSDGNIDSLLYRCGHMCSCFKCANELIKRGAKCPMCRAPVVDVIRAYSIQ
ncbi:Ring/U-Box superfamily protein [Hibiscus syriacus]|uniref:Ring/U-Box superfamily protein n=1 Tax=Hibiscus syriacus TaxID=106335 RepID=A0A6A2ZJY7_HIBSY|nr:Ring/U-Box superfamily protein [Hibiscus syriacus]